MIELREYQKEVVDQALPILMNRGIVYLALETRTGKTIIALTLAQKIGLPVLFVTKKKAIPSITNDHNQSGYGLDLTVVNYEMLKTIKPQHRLIIIDEAHSTGAFPKPNIRAKQLRKLTPNCPVVLLSATPTPESLTQIYHQLWAANARLSFIYQYESFYKWAHHHVRVKQKRIGTGQFVNDYTNAIEALIKPELDKIMITLTQAEAGFNFTDLDEGVIEAKTPGWIKDIYGTLKKDGIKDIRGRLVIADTAVSRLSKLHQLCGGTVIDEKGNGMILSTFKIEPVRKLFAEFGKVAIYYKFQAESDLLRQCFADDIILDWQEFQKADTGIYLSQFQSGREGINLSTAKAIIFYTMDHAYLSYEQTKNRLQKIDRTERGKLFFIMSDTGLEKKILQVVRKKHNFTSIYFKRWEKEWNPNCNTQ